MDELAYTKNTPLSYRKKFGQFFTPRKIADLMLNWVIQDHPQSILDPAFGLGIFYDSLNSLQSKNEIHYFGYEIDPKIIHSLAIKKTNNLTIYLEDYLEAKQNKYDAIICNPPYLRFQNFVNRHQVIPELEKTFNLKFNGYSNIASVFLLKSLQEINPEGRMAYLMPFEFFNTGYGKIVKEELIKTGFLKQIIIFENEKDIFAEVTTTICLILCKNDRQKAPIKVGKINELSQINKIEDFNSYFQYKISPDELPYEKKWSYLISSRYQELIIPKGLAKISDYGKFVRGIATGANEFFALNQKQVNDLEINSNNLLKCLTKSSQVRQFVFSEKDYQNLLELGYPVMCLNVQEPDNQKIKKYLEYGVSQGFNSRYLTKQRKPWYKLESRLPAPILAGVFNRGRLKVIRNFTNAINFTCFHGFYPNLFGDRYLNRLFVYLISDLGQKVLMTNKRQYGNNLDKFEPRDLNEGNCPTIAQFEQVLESDAIAIIEIAKTNEKEAIKQANAMVKVILNY